jgi:hypothetical protein
MKTEFLMTVGGSRDAFGLHDFDALEGNDVLTANGRHE